MVRTTTSILPMRVLEYWYGSEEDWGLNGMVDETWLTNPTDSRVEVWDLYNLEKYVHQEVDKEHYLRYPGIYMVVKKPSRFFYGFSLAAFFWERSTILWHWLHRYATRANPSAR